MPIEVGEREIQGITILDLRGRLVLGDAISTVQERVERLLREAKTSVILNLQHVPMVDSSGLGFLVVTHTSFEQAAGGLRLLKLQEKHLQLLVLTKLSTFFQVFDEERAAIDSFFPDRQPRSFDILEFVQSQNETMPEPDRAAGKTAENETDPEN